MHTLTLCTKYTFGDRVRFDSQIQGIAGTGVIVAITVDALRQIDYIIDGDGEHRSQLIGGILEGEISLEVDS